MVDKQKGILFNIQKFCTQDGPGIRTTVFLKGCPLRCKWCHNPESFTQQPILGFLEKNCLSCRSCEKVCTQQVHTFTKLENQVEHKIARKKCLGCGRCVENCKAHALKLTGYLQTPEQIIREVKKDMPFYEMSGGGLTISGGEPFMQKEFTLAVLKKAKEEGIHTCVETSGYVNKEVIIQAIPYIDLLLWDIKETNSQKHLEYTGGELNKVLNNLASLEDYKVPVVLRCPIIPTVNDTEEHFQNLKDLKKRFSCIKEIEIMPYHHLGEHKRIQYGIEGQQLFKMPSNETIKCWQRQVE